MSSTEYFFVALIFLRVFVIPINCENLYENTTVSESNSDNSSSNGSAEATGSAWNYGSVNDWRIGYPDCGGSRQSPINIDFSQTIVSNKVLSNLRYVGYEAIPESMTIMNNGHSVEITGVWTEKPYITGGGLSGQYVFEQFHFHWGSGNPFPNEGAEHTFAGKTLPLELHLVHYKRRYGSIEEAAKYQDGLVVIGRVFWVNEHETNGFDSFKNSIRLVTEPGTERQIRPFPLADFQFNLDDNFLTYQGSLTTPPCSEVVTWILPTTPLWVTNDVLRKFRSVKLNDGDKRNNRPVQPLNGRKILFVRYNYALPMIYPKKDTLIFSGHL